MPNIFAIHNISGAIDPDEDGGVQTIIFLHPAMEAGISCIKNDEINGAVPPGTYIPTDSIGLNSFQIDIPFVVSIDDETKLFFSFSQIILMLLAEFNIACFKSSAIEFSALLISDFFTLNDLTLGRFNSSFISLKALVPFLELILYT